jgi:hypothetical protein
MPGQTAEPRERPRCYPRMRFPVRGPIAIIGLCLALAGCALEKERQSLGYGDYAALSCDQLGQETVNLMRAAADRNRHILADDQARRDAAKKQLDLVKQAYAEKQC